MLFSWWDIFNRFSFTFFSITSLFSSFIRFVKLLLSIVNSIITLLCEQFHFQSRNIQQSVFLAPLFFHSIMSSNFIPSRRITYCYTNYSLPFRLIIRYFENLSVFYSYFLSSWIIILNIFYFVCLIFLYDINHFICRYASGNIYCNIQTSTL